jgi:hypothetical protein
MAQEITVVTVTREKELLGMSEKLLGLQNQIQLVLFKLGDLVLDLKDCHIVDIQTTLIQFFLDCHSRRVMIQFDNVTLERLYLMDREILEISLAKCFQFERLKNLKPDDAIISLSFSAERYMAEDIKQEHIDKMIAISAYEEFLSTNSVVYLCLIKERDVLLGCYVEDAEASVGIFNPRMYAKFDASRLNRERAEKKRDMMEAEKSVGALAMQRDTDGQVEEITRSVLRNTVKSIQHENDKIDIDREFKQFIALRVGTLSHCPNGLAGCSALFEGFFEHSATMTNRALERIKKERREQGLDFNDRITLSRGTLKLADFDTNQKKSQTPLIREIMADHENRVQIERHIEHKININTMDVMLGKDALSRTVIPCVVQDAYGRNVHYVVNVYNNNNITINNINNNNTIVLSETNEKYRLALELLLETEKSETKKAIIEEALDTKKRKRVLENEHSNSRRILISERKFKRMKKTKNVDESHYLVITSKSVDNPNTKEKQKCDDCGDIYYLSSFNKRFTKKGTSYEYWNNVCRTCIKRDEKTKKKSRVTI